MRNYCIVYCHPKNQLFGGFLVIWGGGERDKKVVIKLMRINVSQSDRIIDSFPQMLKFKIMILKPVLLALRSRSPGLAKLVLVLGFLF